MAADKATRQLNRRKVPGLVKATLVAVGLIAAGIVAITLVENRGPAVHAAAAATPQAFAATSDSGANVPEIPSAMENYLSSSLYEKASSPISGPRECNAEQGIVDNCTYQ